MKPIKFKGHNVTFAENQKEYQPLPALKVPSPEGQVIFCMELEDEEILDLVRTGHLWIGVLTFNNPLQPIMLSTSCPEGLDEVKSGARSKELVNDLVDELIGWETEKTYTKKEVAELFSKFEHDRGRFLAEDAADIIPLSTWLNENGLGDLSLENIDPNKNSIVIEGNTLIVEDRLEIHKHLNGSGEVHINIGGGDYESFVMSPDQFKYLKRWLYEKES